jgi:hypothetical protein
MNIMGVINANNVKTVVSVIIIVVLLLIILNHFFRDLFRLNPFYRNKILLEGFDASGNTVAAPSATATPSATPLATPSATATATATATTPIEDTDKSTMMADLFEKVNNQTDMIRTIKLSDKFTPINIDKTASEPFVILMNLKLLINNGVYKNEMDLNELYDKYIGNKAVQLLVSDINSVNMDTGSIPDIGSLETQYLTRCKSIVDGHQKIIDKILENKSKENNL